MQFAKTTGMAFQKRTILIGIEVERKPVEKLGMTFKDGFKKS